MDDCVFCRIISGEIPSSKVYEDDDVLAFITIEAINPGHTLVIPKKHVQYFYQADSETYQKVMNVVKNIAVAIDEAYHPNRVSLMTMGDEVPHLHVHVVPVIDPGDVSSQKLIEKTILHPEPEERDQWAGKIRANLGK